MQIHDYECPYCGAEFSADEDEMFMEDSETKNIDCAYCLETFVLTKYGTAHYVSNIREE